jgi:hypothetical protein
MIPDGTGSGSARIEAASSSLRWRCYRPADSVAVATKIKEEVAKISTPIRGKR